jgi:2-hydroxy-6-oxonona-2,4-dienedioate hydrolase
MMGREEIMVDGRAAYFWRAGAGEPLLLLHGGWGGAEMHWAPVWDALARETRVLAPELPGVAYESSWAPRSFEQAAEWTEKLMDATETPEAYIAGNSFGAALASRLASRSPGRCLGLILIDGGPPPRAPAVVRRLLTRPRPRQALGVVLRRSTWTPAALEKAFSDPGRAPAELRDVLHQPRPRPLPFVRNILATLDPPVAPPHVRTLVLWGEQDRLPGSTIKAARRLVRSLPDADLAIVPDAGHLPQVEQPDEFVRAVRQFVRSAA